MATTPAPLIISLAGDLDIFRKAEIAQTLQPAYARPHVVLDLSRVRYIDSSFIATMVSMRKARGAKGFPPKHLAGATFPVKRTLELVHLSHIWPRFETIEDAVSAFLSS